MIVMICLATTGAVAQSSDAQREACTPDVFRLCGRFIPNAGAITACLRQEKANLSPACRSVFGGRGRPVASASSD